jgi:lipid II:glycine glycyltransferase (peptidoglycan interpeptide bridge formation enzyme)
MVDIRQTIQYANYLKRNGWQIERAAEINYFIKKFPLVGSVIKIQRPEEIRIKKIKELGKSQRAFQVIIEPKTNLDAKHLLSLGYKLNKSTYLPSKTLQLDLTLPINRLVNGLKKDAKSALRATTNLKPIANNHMENFRKAWKKAAGWKLYVPPVENLVSLKKSFKNNCVMYECRNISQHKVVAGAIFLMADNIAYYWQAFTNKEGRRELAQYRIVWEGIRWAKRRGAKIFDFEGIYDPRFPNKSWQGFTHFKKSFGGYEVDYPGTFTKWFMF